MSRITRASKSEVAAPVKGEASGETSQNSNMKAKSRKVPPESKQQSQILSKFKATEKPKLGFKRPHVKVECEPEDETSDTSTKTSETNDIKTEKLEIKEHASDTSAKTCSSSKKVVKQKSPSLENKILHINKNTNKEHLKIKQECPDKETNSSSSPTMLPKLEKLPAIKTEAVDIEDMIKEEIEIKKETSGLQTNSSSSPKKRLKLEKLPAIKIKTESKSLHWEQMLDNLRQMRKDFNAPVDTMGCDMCMDKSSNPKDARYQALLSLMLSSMTKDNVTYAAMQRLIAYGCTVDKILEISEEKLAELIYPVNYGPKKVKYIKDTTKMIKEQFDGDIPKTVEDLCKLKGVGPKMAHLCMKTAWGENTGIGVDVHVHRISNRIGWVKSKTPEETRKQLEDWLPKELWVEINHLLVGFGQQICKAVKPQCTTCLNNNICPFGRSQIKK